MALVAAAASRSFPRCAGRIRPTGRGLPDLVHGVGRQHPLQHLNPSVAYNKAANEYLVVWSGRRQHPPLVDDEFEIFAQRSSASGARRGGDPRPDMGPNGNRLRRQRSGVAYNQAANEYLVVWRGDDNTAPLVNDEFEIFGQRLTPRALGGGTTSASPTWARRRANYRADAHVAYNSTTTSTSSSGTATTTPTADRQRVEIFGQRLDAAGGGGRNDFRISDMGPEGHLTYSAVSERRLQRGRQRVPRHLAGRRQHRRS